MTKRRITLVVDDSRLIEIDVDHGRVVADFTKVTVESVEDIPEPNRVQEFRVVVETKRGSTPWTRGALSDLIRIRPSWAESFTVTEVEPQ